MIKKTTKTPEIPDIDLPGLDTQPESATPEDRDMPDERTKTDDRDGGPKSTRTADRTIARESTIDTETAAAPKPKRRPRGPDKKKRRQPQERAPQGYIKPLDITPDDAFAEFLTIPEADRTVAELTRRYKKQGVKVSGGTLKNWSAQHKWTARIRALQRTGEVGQYADEIAALIALASSAKPELLEGLIAKMSNRVSMSLDMVAITTPDDVYRMGEALGLYTTVIREYRASQIGPEPEKPRDEREPEGRSDTNGAGNAVVSVGDFRKNVSKGGDVKI